MDIFYVYGDEEINLHHIGNQNDRIEHFIPLEASGKVTLQDGFKVEKGATFAVYPSSY
jgi:hypothetical protein